MGFCSVDLAAGILRKGGCTTTAFNIEFGDKADPAIGFPTQLAQAWCDVVAQLSDYEGGIRLAWRIQRERLAPETRWHRVCGHMEAVVATLFDLGWNPIEFNRWVDDLGREFLIDYASPLVRGQVVECFRQSARRHLDRRAAKWYEGGGQNMELIGQ